MSIDPRTIMHKILLISTSLLFTNIFIYSGYGSNTQQQQLQQFASALPNNNTKSNNRIKLSSIPDIIEKNLVVKAEDVIKGLYPKTAYSLFNYPVDMNKWSPNELRVLFALYPELCDAILKAIETKDTSKVEEFILSESIRTGNDNSKSVIGQVLKEYIKNMIEKFDKIEDLKMIKLYLEMNNSGGAYYTPLSIETYLKSLEYWKDIQKPAQAVINKESETPFDQGYELRIGFYFDDTNNSEIDIPSIDEIYILPELQKLEAKLHEVVKRKQNALQIYSSIIPIFEKYQEIEDLKSRVDPEVQTIQNEISRINEQIENNNKNITTKNNIKNKTTQINNEIKTLQNSNNILKQRLNTFQNQLKEKQQTPDDINNLLTEKQKEFDALNVPQNTKDLFPVIKSVINLCDQNIIPILEEIKKLFLRLPIDESVLNLTDSTENESQPNTENSVQNTTTTATQQVATTNIPTTGTTVINQQTPNVTSNPGSQAPGIISVQNPQSPSVISNPGSQVPSVASIPNLQPQQTTPATWTMVPLNQNGQTIVPNTNIPQNNITQTQLHVNQSVVPQVPIQQNPTPIMNNQVAPNISSVQKSAVHQQNNNTQVQNKPNIVQSKPVTKPANKPVAQSKVKSTWKRW